MKQIIYLFLLLGASCATLSAQDLSFSVSPVVVSLNGNEFEGVGYSTIDNAATTTRDLRWTMTPLEITDTWEVAMCDKNLCYSTSVTTETFVLDPDEAGRMDVHAYPNSTNGQACVEVVVTDLADESLNVTNMYLFNCSENSTEDLVRLDFKVYPNPSGGLFSIKGAEGIARVEVLSIAGIQLTTFSYRDSQWYDISKLPSGTYLVRLIDRDGQQTVSKLMNKL